MKEKHRLAPASQAAYRAIDLHFHDLRHEAGSRWLEAGMPIHHVKQLLGHASIGTTDTYLNSTRIGLQEAMRRAEQHLLVCTDSAQKAEGERPLVCNEERPDAAKPLVN